MRKVWNRVPVRVRAALAALALAAALLVLWGAAADWAVPSPRLALRLAEREHAYGPGQIVAQGELVFQESAQGQGRRWLVSRSGDRFAAVVLERRLDVLWRCEDFLPPMRPTEEAPLGFAFLGQTVLREIHYGNSRVTGMEYILAVCSGDPEIVSVELTMGVMPREFADDPGGWLAEHGVTVQCAPAGEGVWVGQPVLMGQSGGSTNVRLRGYGADGELIYDSGVT